MTAFAIVMLKGDRITSQNRKACEHVETQE